MPFEDFRKVLVRIKEKYDSHKIMIIISGGEPLVREDLMKCGRGIYDLEFPWGMVSNGRLMTPKKIDQLLGAGIHSLTISLDGFEAEHNWMRGDEKSFKCASNAIEILTKEPSIKFDVVTCANNRNYETLEQFKEYLISLGLKEWRIFTVFPKDYNSHPNVSWDLWSISKRPEKRDASTSVMVAKDFSESMKDMSETIYIPVRQDFQSHQF